MVTYSPWSERNLTDIVKKLAKGNMPVLDLELSALCEHRLRCGGCVYCDSLTGNSHPGELSMGELEPMILEAKQDLGLRWIYCCGLGEPSDDPKFRPLVELATELDVSISFFTNGVGYTKSDLRFLYDHDVNLLVKCDSLNPVVFGRLLGTNDAKVIESVYKTIDMAIEIGFAGQTSRGSSRLALSIVPTQYNKEDVLEVVRFCKVNHIYPLLGQLEFAGRGKVVFDTLALTNDELLEMKIEVEAVLEFPYEIPVCPAGIAGLHISNIGECIVHKATGLSCPWFDLVEPKVESLGNVREVPLVELWKAVRLYRVQEVEQARQWIDKLSESVFGGCGGKALLETYLRVQSDMWLK